MKRRVFLASLAALAGFRSAAALAKSRRLPFAFSTLGCPSWDWTAVIGHAARWGYGGIELRGLQGQLDLTAHANFQGKGLKRTLKDLKAFELQIVNIGTSAAFHEPGPSKQRAALDEARRAIDLAARLQAPYIRVFGDRFVEGETRKATVERIADGLRQVGEHAKNTGVMPLIESHGDFTDSKSLLEILERAESANVGLLWDAHHTFVSGKEKPEQTFQQLGRFVRHTHLKDSKPVGDHRRYVLTGNGEVPVAETVKTLVQGGYEGYYCFEWEKMWHPDLEEPEFAIPHFATVIRDYLRDAVADG